MKTYKTIYKQLIKEAADIWNQQEFSRNKTSQIKLIAFFFIMLEE